VPWIVATSWTLLIASVAGGAALRGWRIDALGFNSDETVYAGQAAVLAGDRGLAPYFPVFRAHPLLFQSLLSGVDRLGLGEGGARWFCAAIGLATAYLAYRIGDLLYGRQAGIFAGAFTALMPYGVVVSRQVLLDAPLAFIATSTLYLAARFVVSRRPAWLYATGAGLGLCVLTKETSILLLGALLAFFALSPGVRVMTRHIWLSLGITAAIVATFPLTVVLAGRSKTGGQYLLWQLFRRPNHGWAFYPDQIPAAIGWAVVIVAVAGLWLLRGERSWRETLLVSWIAVPVVFFELWPVKGFQYLLPVAPVVCVLAGRTLARWSPRRELSLGGIAVSPFWIGPVVAVLVAGSLAVTSWQRVQPSSSTSLLAGASGTPGGREAGTWIRTHLPEGARLLTIGPSMANILQFYGRRKAYALSVSTNPLHRNPAYVPVVNPDLRLRSSDIQYVVWDAFSARRSPYFTSRLLRYADRYGGRAIHTQLMGVGTPAGRAAVPLIRIYEVHP
jgi:hypothetical protein